MDVSYYYFIDYWCSVLIPFHSNPTLPEPDPWAVGGDYRGVQDLSFLTSARSSIPAASRSWASFMVTMKNTGLWNVTPCILVEFYGNFRRTCCRMFYSAFCTYRKSVPLLCSKRHLIFSIFLV